MMQLFENIAMLGVNQVWQLYNLWIGSISANNQLLIVILSVIQIRATYILWLPLGIKRVFLNRSILLTTYWQQENNF